MIAEKISALAHLRMVSSVTPMIVAASVTDNGDPGGFGSRGRSGPIWLFWSGVSVNGLQQRPDRLQGRGNRLKQCRVKRSRQLVLKMRLPEALLESGPKTASPSRKPKRFCFLARSLMSGRSFTFIRSASYGIDCFRRGGSKSARNLYTGLSISDLSSALRVLVGG